MTEYLVNKKVLRSSHVLLGQFLGIKPFLTIDNGKLVAIEKAKTRSQVTDRMIEFLLEFVDIEDAMIIQAKVQLVDQARTVQDRFSLEFDGYHCPFMMYGMLMASLVGLQATGVLILEVDSELEQDDF
jgi:fatty acid-binding protein DegV